MATAPTPGILHSCYEAFHRASEQFVPEHVLGLLLAGESQFYTSTATQTHGAGTLALVHRHQLVKTTKVPPAGGRFQSISVSLDQATLRRYAATHQLAATAPYAGPLLLPLGDDSFLRGFFHSLLPYFDQPAPLPPALVELKAQEAIGLLLRHDPALGNWLFHFDEPGKIDLEAFMLQHYAFNVPLTQFAKLTGRSLATFKRDFQRLFGSAPQRWLQQQRLGQAHYLIAERRQPPAQAYLEVGFENLSHFSTAFKQRFGYTASALAQRATRK
ncbi:helix-turn-helix transcriptional regulator [Hymenobacter sp. RP-2-7]|uniref:Helix-turn-helix transcriptional regulator n=1 Tax=Hymenobacter polaris TaxID=2682546 RepID=A0A7Y0AID4_9BACT|nr:AraC family transcriptional regulator [Hymenobacter polaris]NML67908.1 helix-turn-helix transcriptional regulator [Hymenobacter polaris]